MSRKRIAALVAALAITATGCSSVEATSTQKALHFKGGYGQDPAFEKCVDPSNKEYDGPGDNHYTYQMDLRSFDARGGEGTESDPIEVLDKNGETLRVPLIVTFYLNPDCKVLLDFHNTIGAKYSAYNNDKGKPGKGWNNLLDFAIYEPTNKVLDLISKRYTREELRGSEEVRATLEQALADELPGMIKDKTGGKQFFERFDVSVSQPETTNQALIDSIAEAAAAREAAKTVGIRAEADGQAAVAAAKAAGAKAVAEARARQEAAAAAASAAEAEVRVARAEAAKQRAVIDGQGGPEHATRRHIADKGMNPDQPTIIYGPGGQVPTAAPTG